MATQSLITRRAALSSISLASLATCSPIPLIAAASDPDAALFRLEAEFNVAMDAWDAVTKKVAAIEEHSQSMRTPEPTKPPMPDDIDAGFSALTVNELSEGKHPAIIAFREFNQQYRQKVEAWKAECNEITRQSGLREAEAEQDAMSDLVSDVADRLLDIPALTAAGMLVKLRVHERWALDDITASITADLERMAGGAS